MMVGAGNPQYRHHWPDRGTNQEVSSRLAHDSVSLDVLLRNRSSSRWSAPRDGVLKGQEETTSVQNEAKHECRSSLQ